MDTGPLRVERARPPRGNKRRRESFPPRPDVPRPIARPVSEDSIKRGQVGRDRRPACWARWPVSSAAQAATADACANTERSPANSHAKSRSQSTGLAAGECPRFQACGAAGERGAAAFNGSRAKAQGRRLTRGPVGTRRPLPSTAPPSFFSSCVARHGSARGSGSAASRASRHRRGAGISKPGSAITSARSRARHLRKSCRFARQASSRHLRYWSGSPPPPGSFARASSAARTFVSLSASRCASASARSISRDGERSVTRDGEKVTGVARTAEYALHPHCVSPEQRPRDRSVP